tara:strand:+ start:1721 stop:2413 length:693 start_codon:yes stop_codon:yes gene_type:complete
MEFTNPDTARFALENNLEAIQFEETERSGKDGKITKQDVKNKIKQVEKIKNALKEYQGTIPEEDFIKKIIDLAVNVYQNETFRFGATERQYQSALEMEINDKTEWDTQSEIIVGYNYEIVEECSRKRKRRQLPYGLGGREDILIPGLKLIMELKQLTHVRDREFCQLLRYMEERRKYSDWGEETKGLVINFGDRTLEIWLVQYKEGQLERIKMHEVEKTPFKELVKSYKR